MLLRVDAGLLSGGGLEIGCDVRMARWLNFDARGEAQFSKDRHWGIGMALRFSDVGPSFVDRETGARGTLLVSGMTLRLGLRGSW